MNGSSWSKWDLHVHTPASYFQNYTGENRWERWIDDIESLPHEFKVLGINDYLTVEGYNRVLEEHTQNNRMQNIELFLPVVEIRLPQFGGSESKLSKVNYHVIFSPDLSAEVIQNQFINNLYNKFSLSPSFEPYQKQLTWGGSPSIESLSEFGKIIKSTVPKERLKEYGSDLDEGFNNFCVEQSVIQEILERYEFEDKYLTGIGKTEWQDIKWNDQAIASKKHIINSSDFIFTAAKSPENAKKALDVLRFSGVNSALFDCSDAHNYTDSEDKDRIGNCNCWVKAEPSFEGLRQALIEYEHRVQIQSHKPEPPPLRINQLFINLPENTTIADRTLSKNRKKKEAFCFSGKFNIKFNPNFTCLIGGRGVGKSTLINLLQESAEPGQNKFFQQSELESETEEIVLSDSLNVEATCPSDSIEFILQNRVEQLASSTTELTGAIFKRLTKFDDSGELKTAEEELRDIAKLIDDTIAAREKLKELSEKKKRFTQDLTSLNRLVRTVKDDGFKKPRALLAKKTRELGELSEWKESLDEFLTDVQNVLDTHDYEDTEPPDVFEKELKSIHQTITELLGTRSDDYQLGVERIAKIKKEVGELKTSIDVFLQDKGLSRENLKEYNDATTRIGELEAEIKDTDRASDKLQALIAGYVYSDSPLNNYISHVDNLLNPLNAKLQDLGTEVKPIEMEYNYELDDIHPQLCQFISNRYDIRKDRVVSALDSLSWDDIFAEKAEFPQSSTGRKLADIFEDPHELDIVKLMFEKEKINVAALGKINVRYDGRDIVNTSFGQRCTAAIVILLLFGNSPIVIDEPEAHLDSSLIAKYLVNLIKKIKTNRQIIFATHNANFVVNGDSELIQILSMTPDGLSALKPTTIEDLTHREELLGLEGGDEAFRRREMRYKQPA